MLEGMTRLLLAGLGAMNMTREKAENLYEECVRRGQVEKENRSKFVNDLMEAADKARGDMEKMVEERVDKALQKTSLARKEDIERLEAKIDSLSRRKKS